MKEYLITSRRGKHIHVLLEVENGEIEVVGNSSSFNDIVNSIPKEPLFETPIFAVRVDSPIEGLALSLKIETLLREGISLTNALEMLNDREVHAVEIKRVPAKEFAVVYDLEYNSFGLYEFSDHGDARLVISEEQQSDSRDKIDSFLKGVVSCTGYIDVHIVLLSEIIDQPQRCSMLSMENRYVEESLSNNFTADEIYVYD